MKILAPVNFGDASAAVVAFAYGLAGHLGARLRVAHVHQVVDDPAYDGLRASANAALSNRLHELVHRACGKSDAEVVVEAVSLDANPVTGITTLAREADLVVIGQTESHGVWRFMLGDTTAAVIEHARTPVLVVPAGYAFSPPDSLNVVVEGAWPPPAYANPLRYLARHFDARLEIFRVVASDTPRGSRDEEADEVAAFAYGLPHAYHVAGRREVLFEYLTSSLDRLETTWLCAFHHPRSAWQRAMTRTFEERLAAIAPLPTLILVDAEQPNALAELLATATDRSITPAPADAAGA